MANSSVLAALPQVQNQQGIFSVLSRLDGKVAWSFLMQPTEMTYERNSNYAGSNAIGTIASLSYGNTDGWTCSINNLNLSSLAQRRSLLNYVNSLAALGVPDADAFAPPILALIWGQRRFSPCVLTRFSKVEKLWYPNGDLAECAVSFTLLEAPEDQIVAS